MRAPRSRPNRTSTPLSDALAQLMPPKVAKDDEQSPDFLGLVGVDSGGGEAFLADGCTTAECPLNESEGRDFFSDEDEGDDCGSEFGCNSESTPVKLQRKMKGRPEGWETKVCEGCDASASMLTQVCILMGLHHRAWANKRYTGAFCYFCIGMAKCPG
jgi:hypothetical protein